MRACALLFICGWALPAVEVPVGTILELRLTTPVSTAGSQKHEIAEGIVIAPVTQGAIPAGAVLTGSVSAVTPPTEAVSATLTLKFDKLTIGGRPLRIAARVSGVDNARERVDDAGTIQGIDPKETPTRRMDQGIGKLSNGPLSGLAEILESAKGFLLKDADPNITYPAGTELTVRLLKPLIIATATPNTAVPPVQDNGHLSELVNNQVARTAAVHPDRPSDVTNLMFIGELAEVRQAFRDAGWSGTDSLTGGSKWETARAIIEQRGFKEAPVSTILLDHRAPDLVLQKANNTFSARHHIRIWHSPDTYRGQQVWLAAATHDIAIDFSRSEKTFVHKIDSRIDLERRKVADDLIFTGKARAFTLIARPEIPANFHNGTGDEVETDGRMAVLQF